MNKQGYGLVIKRQRNTVNKKQKYCHNIWLC